MDPFVLFVVIALLVLTGVIRISATVTQSPKRSTHPSRRLPERPLVEQSAHPVAERIVETPPIVVSTTRCPLCHHLFLPTWFVQHVGHGGVLHLPPLPVTPAAYPDKTIDGIDSPYYNYRSGPDETVACYHCTDGWPYPETQEDEESYVDRLKQWKLEQKRLDEGTP